MQPLLATIKPLVQFLASQVSNQGWYLDYLKQTTTRLPPIMSTIISEFGADDFPKYFTDEKKLRQLFVDGIDAFPEVIKLIHIINQLPPEEVQKFVANFMINLSKIDPDAIWDDIENSQTVESSCDDIPEEEKESIRNLLRCGMLVFTDLTSVLIFGERIFSLVKKALSGNADSFGKVIQLTPSAARYIPEFKEMISDAVVLDRTDLLDKINYRKYNFVGNSMLDYHHINVVFYLLDVFQLLGSTSNKEILNIYIDCGLGDYEEILVEKVINDKRKQYLSTRL